MDRFIGLDSGIFPVNTGVTTDDGRPIITCVRQEFARVQYGNRLYILATALVDGGHNPAQIQRCIGVGCALLYVVGKEKSNYGKAARMGYSRA